MSTSFYGVFKEKMSVKIDGKPTEVSMIKIGQRSGGWKFQFEGADMLYWKPTKESLLNWLNERCSCVVDEYGLEYTFDGFFERVDYWNGMSNNTHVPMEHEFDPKSAFDEYLYDRCGKVFKDSGYNVSNYGFENDGFIWVTFDPEYN